MPTVTVVTGANSGIGRATAIHLAKQGHDVYGTAREPAKAEKLRGLADAAGVEVHLVRLNVADDASVRDAFAEITARAGRVDVLVNNAGVGGNATAEDSTPAALLEVMNVNLCGVVRCVREVLPAMRARRAGTIVNLTSVVGRFASTAQAPYVTSKWALEGFTEELAFEVAPFGIRVAIVEPGVTKSAIFAKNVDVPATSADYEPHYTRLLEFYAAGIPQGTNPTAVAEVIEHAITTDAPKLRYACSWGGRELISGRAAMTDEEWVDLGRSIESPDYWEHFAKALGFDIAADNEA